jgi:hypothetical protein
MKKELRTKMTIPAHRDHEELLNWCLERGYTYLGMRWMNGRGIWELEIVETVYTDENGKQVGYLKILKQPLTTSVIPISMTRVVKFPLCMEKK